MAKRSHRSPARFVTAGVFWRPLLHVLGAIAITMRWRRIYVLAEHQHDRVLQRHEMIHIEQMEGHGTLRFCVL